MPRAPYFPILLAAFAFLMFVGAPHSAKADIPAFDSQTCQKQLATAASRAKQDITLAQNKIWSNATPLAMNTDCLAKVMSMFETIGTLTDPFNIIWQLVLSAIKSFVNQICSQVLGIISSAITMLKNAVCLPLPSLSLNFSLGSLGGGTCNGVSLLNISSSPSAAKPAPNRWMLWNLKQ